MTTRLQGYYPYSEIPFKKGDVVTVPKGTLIKSTGGAPKVSTRTQKVTVHHVMPGSMAFLVEKLSGGRFYFDCVDRTMEDALTRAGATEALKILQGPNVDLFAEEIIQDLEGRGLLRWDGDNGYLVLDNPQVVWPGSGGYWREADVNNVVKA